MSESVMKEDEERFTWSLVMLGGGATEWCTRDWHLLREIELVEKLSFGWCGWYTVTCCRLSLDMFSLIRPECIPESSCEA